MKCVGSYELFSSSMCTELSYYQLFSYMTLCTFFCYTSVMRQFCVCARFYFCFILQFYIAVKVASV